MFEMHFEHEANLVIRATYSSAYNPVLLKEVTSLEAIRS